MRHHSLYEKDGYGTNKQRFGTRLTSIRKFCKGEMTFISCSVAESRQAEPQPLELVS